MRLLLYDSLATLWVLWVYIDSYSLENIAVSNFSTCKYNAMSDKIIKTYSIFIKINKFWNCLMLPGICLT